MINQGYKSIVEYPNKKIATVVLAQKGYKVKSEITGVYIYCPTQDLCGCYTPSSSCVIDLMQTEAVTKVFLYAEHNVATLAFNNIKTNNYISANSLFHCLDKDFNTMQSLCLCKATEYGVIDESSEKSLNEYTIKLYNQTIFAIEQLHTKIPYIRRTRLFGAIKREMCVLPSIVKLNLNGIKFNYNDWLVKLSADVESECRNIEKNLYTLLRINNINSPQQLLKALHCVGINIPNTDETTLKQFKSEYPLLDSVVKYRKAKKIIDNYGKALTEFMDDNFRIYGIYTAYSAKTGRMSAKKAAVQGFPRISKQYLCAGEGNVLITADYKAVEMCILAHLSHCQTMVDEINAGTDLHRQTASIIFNIPTENVTDEQRQIAKRINFGICYGMTSLGLHKSLMAEGINVSVKDAEDYIKKYFKHYTEIEDWQQACIHSIGVTSLGGRYHSLVGTKPTQAINYPVQASGSDIIKDALIILDNLINADNTIKLVSVIHDSITLEVPIAKKSEAENYLKQAMEQAFQRLVPDVNISIEF
jgi:DNA polymerase-1